MVFHEATETGQGPPQTEGATEHDLPRRYAVPMAESRQDLDRQSQEVLALLRLLGFRINWGKSQLLQTHKLVYLGLTIDTTLMTLTLPEERCRRSWRDANRLFVSVSEGLVQNDVGDRAPGLEDKNTEENTVLPDYGVSKRGIEGRAGVVDRNAQPVEWQGRPILQLTP
jgi:hypothetical protein